MVQLVHDSLTITGFVAGMMLLIEYVNVFSRGRWSRLLGRRRLWQIALAALLGSIPGCLGAFTAVTLYSHGVISFGSVVAAMIASSGDEAFVMLALIPRTAVVLAGILIAIAVTAGLAVDFVSGKRKITWPRCEALVVHEGEELRWPSFREMVEQWRECSATRGVLSVALALFTVAIATGQIGPREWNWVRTSLAGVSMGALFVVGTAPEHFMEDHLWKHVVRQHVPRVFLWTLGALLVSSRLGTFPALREAGLTGSWPLLPLACAIGLLPQSGPHLIFVTLYAQEKIPFGILLASSVVQDGHGMLPMLAHSRKAFIAIKAVNFVVGMAAGALALGVDG